MVKAGTLVKVTLPVMLGAATLAAAQPGPAPIILETPLACDFGETCFIQQYFDHDPTAVAKDYRCGPMVYDGHDGVDLRVSTLARQKEGVTVIAAASGIVRGVRDGMEDVNIRAAGRDSVKGRECGNGVVLLHENGWETQYCHMAKGSVRVRTGEQVQAGAALGQVGMSGDAEFPHLHLAVRRNGEKIDPFAPDARAGTCGGGQVLWSKSAAETLAYRSPELINAGFATGPVTMDDVESGRAAAAEGPTVDSPAMIAFVRAIGLKAGDVQTVTLRGPRGEILARSENPPLDSNKAQWLLFVGKRLTEKEWPRGRYEAQYEVRRENITALIRRFDFSLR